MVSTLVEIIWRGVKEWSPGKAGNYYTADTVAVYLGWQKDKSTGRASDRVLTALSALRRGCGGAGEAPTEQARQRIR